MSLPRQGSQEKVAFCTCVTAERWFSRHGPLTAAASLGNLLEMRILRSHPDPTGWETQGMEPAVCILTSPPGNSHAGKA